MARIGYARVSSGDQNLDRQLEALKKSCSKIFSDKLSGKNTNRPALLQMLDYIREGDIVVVTELERLGRNSKELTDLMYQIQSKKATLEILNLPTTQGIEDENLRNLINNLIIEIYKYQAESERMRILERQKQGIAIAKREGKYKGRKPLFPTPDERLELAFKFYKDGLSDKDVERKTGINRETFRRYRLKYGVERSSDKAN
ncbi:recombinase family protein [Enterococcus hulanensis]|uniref:recombinase family protein n=1 Tax=Enterococcus hulanensis TaxID=2559929 RepID=UPI0010F439F3|nr:recombinase family protein [Enterococcus hulanensis]